MPQTSVRVSARVKNTYAIRNIVAAKKVSRRTAGAYSTWDRSFGSRRRPIWSKPLPKRCATGTTAIRRRRYQRARRRRGQCVNRGVPMSTDRVVLTSGTSEGIELALGAGGSRRRV